LTPNHSCLEMSTPAFTATLPLDPAGRAPPLFLSTSPCPPASPFHADPPRRQRRRISPSACEAAPVADRDAKREARRAADRDLVAHTTGIPSFSSLLPPPSSPLARRSATTLQINIGLTCSLACRHCHVESSPARAETMSRAVAERLVALTRADPAIQTVDITGGAPEMHEQFRYLVREFRGMGLRVLDRCNLDVLTLPGQEDLGEFLASNGVQIVASLPCYTPENVEKQRGDGVFDASICALQVLNALGYGVPGSGLDLDLVYNPLGPSLPPPQANLEEDYRCELKRAFGIVFTRLICITNMPIKRFADDLLRTGMLQGYMDLLVSSFNPDTVDAVMCRDQVHVAYDGSIHDCDFNYALDIGVTAGGKCGATVFDIASWQDLVSERILTGPHCFGCTAGNGSSCSGALE
jgi:radical SAM/Cys-rich protein